MGKCKPILFSTPMVQSILDGRKTQTRRIIKKSEDYYFQSLFLHATGRYTFAPNNNFNPIKDEVMEVEPKYRPLDILWVRETTLLLDEKDCEGRNTRIYYKTEHHPTNDEWLKESGYKWKPSVFMPKEACRIFLEVTDVRVERLQDISESDAIAEGIEIFNNEKFGRMFRNYLLDPPSGYKVPELSFKTLWESINGRDSLIQNPWVWVYDFKRVEKPKNF